jgi:hypothetical protein
MAKTDYQKLQDRAKKLDVPANQSADKLAKAVEKAEAKAEATKQRETAKTERKTEKAGAAAKGQGSSDQSRKPKASESEEEGPKLSEYGGVSPEWHNDPERVLGLDVLEQRDELEARGEVKISTFTPQTHNELTIDFTGLAPNTDFEVRISGPIAQPYWTTLKTDDWGQAQLIWRTTAGGEYEVSGKGPGIDVKGEFSVSSYDADADYRAEKRSKRAKGKGRKKGEVTGSVATVEDPGVMGDKSPGTEKAQPTEKELEDPQITDPAFTPAEHDPDDQGDPTINKTPHPDGSAAFNYREPGEPETEGEESKEGDPKTKEERQEDADEEAAEETAEAAADEGVSSKGVSKNAGQSPPMSDEQVDRENAPTGAEEAGR